MMRLVRTVLAQVALARHKGFVTFSEGRGSKMRYDLVTRTNGCTVTVGHDCIINARISFDREGAKFSCGDRCFIGASHFVCAGSIALEDDVLISWGVTIVDHNSHAIEWHDRSDDVLDWAQGAKNWGNVVIAPVHFGRRSWVGFNAIILKGVNIGEGSIVAAGAVVTKDVPPFTIVGGNPARVIRTLPEPKS